MKIVLTKSETFNLLVIPDSIKTGVVSGTITVSHDFCSRFFMCGNMSFEDTEIVEKPTVSAAIEWIESILKNNKKRHTFTDKWELKAKDAAEKKVLPFLKKHDNALLVRFFP